MRRAVSRLARGVVMPVTGALLVASTGGSVHAQDELKRPKLDHRADTNDWQAYYDHGVSLVRRRPAFADRYFEWASKLHPGRAEPLFGRWVAFWMRDLPGLARYLKHERGTKLGEGALAADSMRRLALRRNPFVDQRLEVFLYNELPGRWSADPASVAAVRYAERDFGTAARILADAIDSPQRRRELGYQRALILVAAGQLDSAAAELVALLGALRDADREFLVGSYYSKALLEYGLGMVLATKGDPMGARAAFERALVEDLAFAPAHEGLGRLALARGDTATAVRELAQAAELSPAEPYLRYQYGAALYTARRMDEALEQFRRVTSMAPLFADAHFGVASARDALGDASGAAAAYRAYLERAPRTATAARSQAEQRLAALSATPTRP